MTELTPEQEWNALIQKERMKRNIERRRKLRLEKTKFLAERRRRAYTRF